MEAFKFGMYDGLFKLQPRATSNCFTDGPVYAKALYHFAKKFAMNRFNVTPQEQFSFEDITQGFFHKCTMQDTLPGTLILRMAMVGIDEMSSDWSNYLSRQRMLLNLIDSFGLFSNVAETAYFINVTLYKSDAFTYGKLFGKILKVVVQVKLLLMTGN